MRPLTKPSTAKCNLAIYTLFLLCEPKYVSCVRLAQILEDVSHDSINRFLWRENYTPKDLFDEVAPQIELEGGTLSVDDMVIDKLYSDPTKADLIDYFWSGKHKLGGLFALEANRSVAVKKGEKYVQVKSLDIPLDGLIVYLKQVGRVKIFKTVFKNEFRYYAMFVPKREDLSSINWSKFKRIHDQHWGIEQYHRALKQVCNIERFQVRESQAIRTHIFCAIRAFVHLEFLRFKAKIVNWYSLKRELFTDVIRSFIVNNLESNFLDLNNL